ncbi:MAG: tetratricopeptide repeat protein [Armatimonadetes bacterium]|nr:tetratricopeptide repeat protein [Armatimonadota bacterium]
MLLPVLGLVDIAYMQHSLVADHWQYLSLVGSIALLVGAAATRVSSWSAPARGAACLVGAAIVVLSTALAHAQAATYHDSGKLWRHSLAINSDSWCAHYNLARYLVLEAGPGEANPLEAIHHFEEALRRKPDHPHAHRQVALVLAWRGDFERAAEHFVAALGLDPNAPDLHYNLALVRARQGRLVEAEAEYRAALRLQPDNVDVLNNLATCLMHQGRMHEAVPLLRKGPQLKPGDPTLQANLNQAMEPSGER